MEKTLILTQPRGFCAGVERAIRTVETALQLHGKPVYVYHDIVHNRHVCQTLEDQGAIFFNHLDHIPDGAVTIYSAHGVPPNIRERARHKHLTTIDATCPLVTKVHTEVHRYHNEGYKILYIGHQEHDEVIGVQGELPTILLITTEDDIDKLPPTLEDKLIVLTQTTLSMNDTQHLIHKLKTKYPTTLSTPPHDDICYATQNRQDAVTHTILHYKPTLFLIRGDTRSSNSNRLVETAHHHGVKAHLIPDLTDLNPTWLEGHCKVGITSGASVPEELTNELIKHLQHHHDYTRLEHATLLNEHIYFPLPQELQQRTPITV